MQMSSAHGKLNVADLIQRAVERISAPLPASPLALNRCGQKLHETKSWQELQIKIVPLSKEQIQTLLKMW